MSARRFGATVLVLALLGGIMVRVAGIHVGNQTIRPTPEHFDGRPGAAVAEPGLDGAVAISVSGTVTALDGAPLAGAMVSAADGGGRYRVTVFTDADGRYSLAADLPAPYTLRVRASGFEDEDRTLPAGAAQVPASLTPVPDAARRGQTATASAHAALLGWEDAETRGAFVSQCHFCHQIGNDLTRAPRDDEDWREVVDRMEGYLVLLTNGQKRSIGATLAATFTGDQRPAVQTHDFSPELAQARIEEWQAGDGYSFIHDAEVGADGKLYGVDEGHDVIWILDRRTAQVEVVPLPMPDLPVGGLFSGLALPIGIFTGRHGPHSLAQDEQGRFWITNALSSVLLRFDPETRGFVSYPIGADALYPHTIRIDAGGNVWFTLAGSNQVARFDPGAESFTLIDLPSNGLSRWVTDAFLPMILKIAALVPRGNLHIPLSHYKLTGEGRYVLNMPYGIDVHPGDGSIWYAKLYANRIGRIDPQTLEISEWITPLDGPRRPRFGADGILWIPSFDESGLMRFDPATGAFDIHRLPVLAEGEYETPYALNVHPQTGDVWITSNLSDRVFRFDPATETFTSYPSPTRVTFLRDLVFAEDGAVCSSQSNLPAYAIEGGLPGFICIHP